MLGHRGLRGTKLSNSFWELTIKTFSSVSSQGSAGGEGGGFNKYSLQLRREEAAEVVNGTSSHPFHCCTSRSEVCPYCLCCNGSLFSPLFLCLPICCIVISLSLSLSPVLSMIVIGLP